MKRNMDEPYASSQEIFERGKDLCGEEEFANLYKADFIEVTGMVVCKAERAIDASPYLKALLHRGLKMQEVEENVGKEVETLMMFTSVIRVEVLNEVANVNEKIDWVVLESVGREVGVRANLH